MMAISTKNQEKITDLDTTPYKLFL